MRQLVGVTVALILLATVIQQSEQKYVSDPHKQTTTTTHDVQRAVYPMSWQCEIDALEEEGWVLDSCEAAAMDEDEFYVKHGGACKVVVQDPVARISVLDTVTCQGGQWSAPGTASALDFQHHRQKRLFWIAAGIIGGIIVGAVVGAIGCKKEWWCKGETIIIKEVIKKAPKYRNCPPGDYKTEYFTPAGQEERTIRWTDPDATDSDGTIRKNGQVFGTTNGGSFAGSRSTAGRQHRIMYEAEDNDGMRGFCHFKFTVKVKTCGALLWPHNGFRDCSKDNILGSTCNYTCNEGYILTKNISETTCTGDNNPQWSTGPSCEKISCATPANITDGNITCNGGHEYGDSCFMSCRDGFRLQGQVYTRCEKTGHWFWGVPTKCVDDVAPELTCKTPQIFYADRASSSIRVEWNIPPATDNIDGILTATKTDGPDQGTVIHDGRSEVVTYVATDAAGNKSPQCNIELRVEVIRCNHPLNTLEDARLRFTCNSSPAHIYGDTCTLECDLNLPLEGTDLITCERNDTGVGAPVGYWDWGNGSMPYCRNISCPPMKPSRNGALVFDWIAARPTTTMLCNEKFDTPQLGAGFNGIFFCQDSGKWNPYYENSAPDCTETYSARGYVLPSEFFYYSGVCGVNDTVLENFANIVGDLKNFFAILCPVETVCVPQNPTVTCGEYDRRKRSEGSDIAISRSSRKDISHAMKKRQTGDVLILSFDIAAFFDTSNMTNKEQYAYADHIQLNVIKPAVKERVVDGDFDRPGWAPLQNDSFETAEFGEAYCDPGSVPVRQTQCNKCPAGHFEFERSCVVCPIGEFCDTSGSVACTQCPVGYSTRHHASDSVDNCTQLCTPGTYAPDTLVPCSPCKVGFFQPSTGQSQCLVCPLGMSTNSAGSMAQSDCQFFDANVTDIGTGALEIDIPLLNNLGIELYAKSSIGIPNIDISVNGKLDIAITDTISVTTASTTDVLGPSSDNAWIQVSVYWDTVNGDMKAYYRGNLVVNHTSIFPTTVPLVENGYLFISASGTAVTSISGLRVLDVVPGEYVSSTNATSCHNINSSDVVNMDAFKNPEQFTLLVPSMCEVTGECLSSPCGDNGRCTNIKNGFTCTCNGGWTGSTCSTPPDYCLDNDCKNGAICLSGTTNYTCQCKPGFLGVFCEIPPVNGGWSVWSVWTECSVTCNTGSRERTRACDSPEPSDYGQACVGDTIEIEDCNIAQCRECPSIIRGYAALPKCEVSKTGTQVCTAVCKDGYDRPPGLGGNDTYTCGMETNYMWQPKQNIPACVKPSRAERYSVSTSGSLDSTVPNEDEQVVISGISSNMGSTPCFLSALCTVDVNLVKSHGRITRNAGTTATITFSIDIKDTSDLQLDKFVQDGTVSPGMQEIIDAINNLEATASAINNSASTYFDVTANGISYKVDTDTVTFDGAAICKAGQVVTNGLCAECPAGSYQVGDYCSLCDKGKYQDQMGQAVCVQCPAGLTTTTVGSDSSDYCFEIGTRPLTTPGHVLTNKPHFDDSSNAGLVKIIAIVGSVLIVITGGIVVVILFKKHNKSRAKVSDSTPDFQGLTNHIYNIPPVSAYVGKGPLCSDRPPTVASVRDLAKDVTKVDSNTKAGDNSLYA